MQSNLLFGMSRESCFPYKFDLGQVPLVDSVKVNRKIVVHSEIISCTASLGYAAHCCIKRLQKFDYSFGKHLRNPLN